MRLNSFAREKTALREQMFAMLERVLVPVLQSTDWTTHLQAACTMRDFTAKKLAFEVGTLRTKLEYVRAELFHDGKRATSATSKMTQAKRSFEMKTLTTCV